MEQTAYHFKSIHLGAAFMSELKELGYYNTGYELNTSHTHIVSPFGFRNEKSVGFNQDDDDSKVVFQLETQWNEALEHARQQLQPEFKVGDWVVVVTPCSTSNNKDDVVAQIKTINDKEGLIDFGPCTTYEVNGWHEHASALRKATPEEIESALVKEAKRRGYKKGVKFKSVHNDAICTATNKFKYDPDEDCLYQKGILSNGIYNKGKWAEIIKDTKFFGYDTKVSETEVKIGCKLFGRDQLERFLGDLSELDKDLTIDDILSEAVKIGLDPFDLPF